jgi:hypothetical protein
VKGFAIYYFIVLDNVQLISPLILTIHSYIALHHPRISLLNSNPSLKFVRNDLSFVFRKTATVTPIIIHIQSTATTSITTQIQPKMCSSLPLSVSSSRRTSATNGDLEGAESAVETGLACIVTVRSSAKKSYGTISGWNFV